MRGASYLLASGRPLATDVEDLRLSAQLGPHQVVKPFDRWPSRGRFGPLEWAVLDAAWDAILALKASGGAAPVVRLPDRPDEPGNGRSFKRCLGEALHWLCKSGFPRHPAAPIPA